MTMHGSATALEETPHANQANTTTTISDALRRRAHAVINDVIDPRWRAVVPYALEVNDPWLADLVRRADAGEPISDSVDFSLEPQTLEDDPVENKQK